MKGLKRTRDIDEEESREMDDLISEDEDGDEDDDNTSIWIEAKRQRIRYKHSVWRGVADMKVTGQVTVTSLLATKEILFLETSKQR